MIGGGADWVFSAWEWMTNFVMERMIFWDIYYDKY
jgi:hypothetical protein